MNTSVPERSGAPDELSKQNIPADTTASSQSAADLKLVKKSGRAKKQRGTVIARYGATQEKMDVASVPSAVATEVPAKVGAEMSKAAETSEPAPPTPEAKPVVPITEVIKPTVKAAEPKKEVRETRERRAGIEPMATIVVRSKRGLEVREVPFANLHYSGSKVFVREAGSLRVMPDALTPEQQKVFRRLYLKKYQLAEERATKIKILKEARDFFDVLENVSGLRTAVPAELPEELREFSPRLAEVPVLPEVVRTPTSDDFLEPKELIADVQASEAITKTNEIPLGLVRVTQAPSFDDYAKAAESGARATEELVERGVLVAAVQTTQEPDRDVAIDTVTSLAEEFFDAEERIERIAKKTGGPEKEVTPSEKALSDAAWESLVETHNQAAARAEQAASATDRPAEPAGEALIQLGKDATDGLPGETVERVGKDKLLKTFLKQAAEKAGLFGLIKFFRGEKAKTPDGEKVPSGFAQAVEKARKAADNPKVRFARERLKGVLTMSWLEWRQAEAFRFRTNEIANNIAENYSAAALRYKTNEIYREALIDSATTQLRERLGKMSRFGSMRTYRGEKTADVLEQRLEQVTAYLKAELEKAAQENKKIDGRELAKALRENIDPEYWKRYIWGSAELALAAGGAAMLWLKPASAVSAKALGTKIATRGAIKGSKELVTTLTEAATNAASLEPPTSPEAVDNARVVSKNIWNTVRQWYVDHGVNPTNQQILDASKEIAKANDVSVPEWNIKGSISARRLATGIVLKGFGKLAKEIVANA